MSKQQSTTGARIPAPIPAGNALDRDEVGKFEALAAEFWNPNGPMRPLHLLNPPRIAYLRETAAAAALGTADPRALRPFAGLRLVDVGCGAGLLSEPMARLGAAVTGIDPSPKVIEAARAHAEAAGLAIDYRAATVEDLALADERFDITLAMEVVEHTPDPDLFIAGLADITRPGGLLVMSTLNRTARAWLGAILGAEYLLGWLPRGTHDWRRFVPPAMLARLLRRRGFRVLGTRGISYRPAEGDFVLSHDRGINYLISALRT